MHLLSPKVLHIFDRSLWLLPFATPTDLEKAAKTANVSVAARSAFLYQLLAEHEGDGARSQLKGLWTTWIEENYSDVEDVEVAGSGASASDGCC